MKRHPRELPPQLLLHIIAMALLFSMPFIAYIIIGLLKLIGGYFFLLAIALLALAYEYFHTFNSN